MEKLKLGKFLWFLDFDSRAQIIGYFGLMIGCLIFIADLTDLVGTLQCEERTLDACEILKISKSTVHERELKFTDYFRV